jgi:hypothetical protein
MLSISPKSFVVGNSIEFPSNALRHYAETIVKPTAEDNEIYGISNVVMIRLLEECEFDNFLVEVLSSSGVSFKRTMNRRDIATITKDSKRYFFRS